MRASSCLSFISHPYKRTFALANGPPQKQLDSAYGQFITSLEEVDLIATRAIQADNTISDEDLKKLATKCVCANASAPMRG